MLGNDGEEWKCTKKSTLEHFLTPARRKWARQGRRSGRLTKWTPNELKLSRSILDILRNISYEECKSQIEVEGLQTVSPICWKRKTGKPDLYVFQKHLRPNHSEFNSATLPGWSQLMEEHFIWRSQRPIPNSWWRYNWRNKGAESDLKPAQHSSCSCFPPT